MPQEVIWESKAPHRDAYRRLSSSTSLAKAGGTFALGDFAYGGKRMPLFTNVRLIQPLQTEGESLPSGAIGTIVECLNGGVAYIVEFSHPHHAVVTVYDRTLVAKGK